MAEWVSGQEEEKEEESYTCSLSVCLCLTAVWVARVTLKLWFILAITSSQVFYVLWPQRLIAGGFSIIWKDSLETLGIYIWNRLTRGITVGQRVTLSRHSSGGLVWSWAWVTVWGLPLRPVVFSRIPKCSRVNDCRHIRDVFTPCTAILFY